MTALSQDLLLVWKKSLQTWAAEGSINRAARDALTLQGEQALLDQLISQWSKGDFSGLPPIELLDAEAMPGAAGAYAASTGTIYLNSDWLSGASDEQVHAVLTEELGHHLDAQLNESDTPGDEGELFSKLLLNPELSGEEIEALRAQDDTILINAAGNTLEAEAAVITGTEIADTLVGGFGDDDISGLGGNDTIDGQAGSDLIRGGDGNDTIEGNFGDDRLYGDAGDDTITDDQGSNILDGGDGNDNLTSKSLSGDHTLVGGSGNDRLNATGKVVNLDGGVGNDQIAVNGYLRIGGAAQYVQNGDAKLIGDSGEDGDVSYYSKAELRGGNDNDWINAEYSKDVLLHGETGDDNLNVYINTYETHKSDGNSIPAAISLSRWRRRK